ncbi:MAG: phosphatidate cytidylyltransferase, partial [Bacteroidota bacterium]
NNFTLRAISGFFYAITVVGCILLSPATLSILMFVIAFFCAFEWARIHEASKLAARGFGLYTWLFLSPFVTNLTPLQAAGIAALIALLWITHRLFTQGIAALNHAKNLGLGILYIALPIYLFLLLAQSQHLASGAPHTPHAFNYLTWPSGGFLSPGPGPEWPEMWNAPNYLRGPVLLVFVLIWSSDTFAYLTGRAFGKTPLHAELSPKKTWEGFIGGTLLTAAVGAYCFYAFFDITNLWQGAILGALMSVFGTAGDLFESALKREKGIKDSGKFLPGHGGALDRFDAFLFGCLLMWALAQIWPMTQATATGTATPF